MTALLAVDREVEASMSPRARHLLRSMADRLTTWERVRSPVDRTAREWADDLIAQIYASIDNGRDPITVIEATADVLQDYIGEARQSRQTARDARWRSVWAAVTSHEAKEAVGIAVGIAMIGFLFAAPLLFGK